LLEALELVPAHVVTSSFGGTIALRLAIRRPEAFASLSCHEPPVWGPLEGDHESREILQQSSGLLEAIATRIAAGDHEAAARQFVDEVAFGPGAWENALPLEGRAVLVQNAPTFLDELRDPDALKIDEDALKRLEISVRLTEGSESSPVFRRVVERLAELIPRATRETFEGAAHVPQFTSPKRYVEVTKRALLGHAAA
jgi:pimeloyl-ACP methyl ester carboxylesterase